MALKMGRKSCKIFFTILCCIVVAFMVSYWYYKYEIEDRDIGVVDYVSLEEATEVEFPVASLCFVSPFKSNWVNKTSSDINTTAYLQYLKGNLDDQRFKDIDYEHLSLNISDYFIGAKEIWKKGSEYTRILQIDHTEVYNGFYHNTLTKCFAFNIKMGRRRSLKQIHLDYNLPKLLDDWYSDTGEKPMIFFDLQYPGQFLLRVNDASYILLHENDQTMTIWIKEIEFLKSRNSRQRNCVEGEKSYDEMVLKKHLAKVGCKSPYHSKEKHFPTCDSPEKIKKSIYDFHNVRDEYYPKACHRLSKILFANQRFLPSTESQTWTLTIGYPDDIRIITQYQEVDVHSLIGNIGGYIGLFLGRI